MAIQSMQLDPDAQAYTDDEIVGKVNAATAKVNDAALLESADFQKLSQVKEDKLDGIAEGAEVNPADLADLDPTQNTKLDGIEEGAKDDQSGDEIVTAINVGTTPITRVDSVEDPALKESVGFQKITEAKETKLDGIEDNAKADQSGAEIKTAYEAEENAFTDIKNTKLSGIEEGAKDDQSGDEIVAAIDAGAAAITREDALSQDDLKIVKTAPTVGEFQIKNVQRQADGKVDVDYDDVPEA